MEQVRSLSIWHNYAVSRVVSVFRFSLKSGISVRELYFGGVAVQGGAPRKLGLETLQNVQDCGYGSLWVPPPQWPPVSRGWLLPVLDAAGSMGDGAVPRDLCSCKYDLIPYCPFGPLGNSPSRRPDRLDQESIWSMRSCFRSRAQGSARSRHQTDICASAQPAILVQSLQLGV